MKQQNQSSQEERLDVFLGKWDNSGRVMPGSFGEWAVGDKWLQYTSRLELPGMGRYEVQGGVVYNNQTGKYDAYAVNNMGALMVYEGDWLNETTLEFTLTHPAPTGRARIVYQILPNSTIQMNSDRLTDNETFETYFETVMAPVQ